MRVSFLAVLLLIFISLNSKAQGNDRWQIGINAAPFYFGRYNGHEYTKKEKGTFPFGYSAGVTIEKNWNKNWGIRTGFEFSEQKRKEYEILNIDGVMDFSFTYFKAPVSLQYSFPVNNKRSLYLVFSQGVQVSFLNDYKYVLGVEESGYTIYTPNKRSSYNTEGELISKSATEWLFERKVVGLIGSVGLKKFVSTNFSVSANVRYEFDLTNADAFPLLRKDLNDAPNWEPKTTHNYRLGLEFGIQYHFEKKQKVYVEGIL